ncbi:MAG TPA: class I SAM-dependent methyltransferase [Desulfuromonadales bacterium]|nr:class I SAM-dependent methyltransferase [Desulfuromonadales bacterium]
METSFSSPHPQIAAAPYDFRRCKLCGSWSAAPLYRLSRSTVYACSLCDFHAVDLLDPLPGQDTPGGRRTLDERSAKYMEERMKEVDPLLPLRLKLLREHSSPQGARCLDIGAGTGQFMERIIGEGGSVRGLEPSGLRREFAWRKYGFRLLEETIESFSDRQEQAACFDMATLWDVIEHVNFPLETLQGAIRILKPGGFLFIDTPSRDSVAYRLSEWAYRLSGGKSPLFLETFYPPVPYGHKQIFRPRQLVLLAEQVGFEVVRLDYDFVPAANRIQSLIRPRKRIVLVCQRPAS